MKISVTVTVAGEGVSHFWEFILRIEIGFEGLM